MHTKKKKSWEIRIQEKPSEHDRDGIVVSTYSHLGNHTVTLVSAQITPGTFL